jgi:hypothetical protein
LHSVQTPEDPAEVDPSHQEFLEAIKGVIKGVIKPRGSDTDRQGSEMGLKSSCDLYDIYEKKIISRIKAIYQHDIYEEG